MTWDMVFFLEIDNYNRAEPIESALIFIASSGRFWSERCTKINATKGAFLHTEIRYVEMDQSSIRVKDEQRRYVNWKPGYCSITHSRFSAYAISSVRQWGNKLKTAARFNKLP